MEQKITKRRKIQKKEKRPTVLRVRNSSRREQKMLKKKDGHVLIRERKPKEQQRII